MNNNPVKNVNNAETVTLFRQLDYGFNIKTRTVYLENEIDILGPCSIQERISAIIELSKDKKSPITLRISSFGGDVYGAFGIIDVIKMAPVKINTLAVGAVMSAAVPIMVSGTGKRQITNNATCMLHEVATWGGGKTSSIEIEVKEMKRLETKLYSILAQHTKQDAAFWSKMCKHVDKYLTPDECLKYGMVDEVLL